MISKETRTEIEKIPCTLKDGGFFQYVSETKKGLITMKCPKCSERGISNCITLTVGKKDKRRK